MKKNSFQSSFSKLYLVSEDVYNRVLKCVSDKTEHDEINSLSESGIEADNTNTALDGTVDEELNSNSNTIKKI